MPMIIAMALLTALGALAADRLGFLKNRPWAQGIWFGALAVIANTFAGDVTGLNIPVGLRDAPVRTAGFFFGPSAGLIAGICLLLAGWFFIRSAILHDGDFLGVAYEEVSRSRVEKMGYILFPFRDFRVEGVSVTGFLRSNRFHWPLVTAESFVGVFGYMTLFLPMFLYGIYFTIFAFGLLRFLTVLLRRRVGRRDGLLMLVMLVSGGINFALHFWQSYTGDYQAQGRYVISLIVPLAYMTACGLDKTVLAVRDPKPGKAAELNPAAVLTLVWLVLFAWAALGTMVKMLP